MRKLLSLLLVLFMASTAMAQNKGKIVGTVSTPDGAVIAGAKVTITSDALIARSAVVMTNERGMYRFVLLPVGDFDIAFEKQGYKTVERKGIHLAFDFTATLNMEMTPADFSEVVTITGEAPVVDKTSSTIGDKLDITFLQNQSTKDRNVWNLPNLSAGFTDGSGFGGVQDAGNSFNIDGNNVSDPQTGTLFANVNFEAVEQVDVNLFGANAEYGAFTGAALNVVTKSGGNEFSGEGNYYAQRVDWVSDNTTDYPSILAPTASDLDTFGLALGGPVMQDKVWFFGNYNYTKTATETPLIDQVISRTENPNRSFFKLSSRWDDRNITYGSFSHYERDRSHRNYQAAYANNYESSLWTQASDDNDYSLQHSFVLNDDVIFEGRFAGYRGFFNLKPRGGDDAPLMIDLATGRMLPGSNANRHDEINRNRENTLVTMNYYNDNLAGTHSMKFGVEYETSLGRRFISLTNFQYFFNGAPLQKLDYGSWDDGLRIHRYAAYAQDSWSINDRLTINFGVRVDRSSVKADDPSIAPIGDKDIFTLTDPAPRFGFAYDLFGDGKTVIRGFAGRYYEGVTTLDTESFAVVQPPTRVYLWGGSDWVLVDESGGTGNVSIDPDFSNQYAEGATVGVEHELMENLGVSATFIYKRDRDIVGEISPDATWTQVDNYSFSNSRGSYTGVYYANYLQGARVILTNPKKGDIGVLVDPTRNYYGLVLEANKRLSDNWSMRANYTYSRNTGTASQAGGIIQGFGDYSNPNNWINADGRLGLERPHQFKLSGTYIAPFDLYISPAFTWLSGQPYAITHTAGGDANAVIYITPISDSDRYDNQMNLDLRVEKSFIFQDRYRLGVIFDAFNVFNDNAVTAFRSRSIDSGNFRVPNTLVTPRFYQLGVRLIF